MNDKRAERIIAKAGFKCFNASLENVINEFYSGKKVKKGSSIFIECPNINCTSKKPDSCSLNYKKNQFHCFNCGCGGSALHMYALLQNVDVEKTAKLELALMMNEITIEEYQYVMGTNTNIDRNKKIRAEKKSSNKEENKEAKIRKPEELNDIFRVLLKRPEFKLSEDAKKHLMEERFLTEQEIIDNMYFTYATEELNVDDFVKDMQAKYKNFKSEHLAGVPGFYYRYTNYSKNQGRWKFINPNKDNQFGHPIMDANGYVIGLQQRRNGEHSTYFWVSSENKNDYDYQKYGCSSGSPAHIEIPKVIKSSDIFVTEGRFKAISLAKSSNRIAISLQGVNTYVSLGDVFEQILKSDYINERKSEDIRNKIGTIYIVFDADFICKKQVFQALEGAAKLINDKGFETRVIIWNIINGKGFDDLYHNNENWKKLLKIIDTHTFIDDYNKLIKDILENQFDGMTYEDIKKSQFFEMFKASVMNEFYNMYKL